MGAAAILYEKNRVRPLKSLQAFIGTPDKHNTYEAEVIGAILALWIIENTPETIGKKVSLFIDNQALVTALSSQKTLAGQHLLNTLIAATNRVGCELTFKWISGHSKVKGNEDVDKLAKEAAAGRSSTMAQLPHILQSPLPISVSAIKQNYMSKLIGLLHVYSGRSHTT